MPTGELAINDVIFYIIMRPPPTSSLFPDTKVYGSSQGAIASYEFSDVTADHTIETTFELTTHTIAASAGGNGSIAPAGAVAVNDGDNQGFTITPAPHYHILDVKVDGVSQGAIASYAFSDVTADHH